MLSGLRKNRSPECISDLIFDEWEAGELSGEELRRVQTHVASCSACSARKESLASLAEQFLREHPRFSPASGRGASAARDGERREKRRRVMAWLGAGAALSAAAIFLLFRIGQPDPFAVRTKGGPHIGFYVKHGDRVTAGVEGHTVRPGDLLRFVVTTDRPRRLAVLSLDSRGAVSIFSPPRLAIESIGPTVEQGLETSVELDDTPGDERIYAVFCDGTIDVQRLASMLEKEHALGPLPGCVIERLTVAKGEP